MIDVGDIFTNLTQIPDTVKDKNSVDIYRIQKYFNTNSWNFLLNLLAKKQDQPFSCYVCNAFIGEKDLVIHCQRCFNRLHLTRSPLRKTKISVIEYYSTFEEQSIFHNPLCNFSILVHLY